MKNNHKTKLLRILGIYFTAAIISSCTNSSRTPFEFYSANGQHWIEKSNDNKKNLTSEEFNLQKVNSAFIRLAKDLSPSVVNIYSKTKIRPSEKKYFFQGQDEDIFKFFFGNPFKKDFFPQMPHETISLGSGFIINNKGFLLTNSHVVRPNGENSHKIMVKFKDQKGKDFPAEIVGFDENTDLAVLRLTKKPPDLVPAYLGSSESLHVGEWVLAIGNPYGHSNTVTQGIVSALGRELQGLGNQSDFIQTSASINPGNSGGPLFNLKGEVVGINTAIDPRAHGIGFAIPISLAKPVIKQLIETGVVTRGWIGVGVSDLTSELKELLKVPVDSGAIIQNIEKGEPAERHGIKVYDVIISVNDTTISSARDLVNSIAAVQPGTKIKITLYRGTKKKILSIVAGKRPTKTYPVKNSEKGEFDLTRFEEQMGFSLQELNLQVKKQFNLEKKLKGILIVEIARFSLADQLGFSEGDIIDQINQKDITTVKSLIKIVNHAKNKNRNVLFRVVKNNGWTRLIVLDTSMIQ